MRSLRALLVLLAAAASAVPAAAEDDLGRIDFPTSGSTEAQQHFLRAAAVVEEVFDRNPLHPGAAHYLIHSYDDPVHAPLGLRPARLDLARGQSEEAVVKLEQAAVLEENAPFGFGPPVPVKPARELLGDVLLEPGRHAEAREQLDKALARGPRRALSLLARRE